MLRFAATKCVKIFFPKNNYQFRYFSDAVKPTTNLTAIASATPSLKEGISTPPPSPPLRTTTIPTLEPHLEKPKPKTEIKTAPFLDNLTSKLHQPIIQSKETETISFDDIPGPSLLRTIAKFWSVVPTFGTELTIRIVQFILSHHKPQGNKYNAGDKTYIRKFFDSYGPIVRLHGAFGHDVVLLSRPEDASAVLKATTSEIRCCLDSVEKYRLEHRRYREIGPFINFGTNWKELRSSVDNLPMASIAEQQQRIDKISEDLIQRMCFVKNRHEEISTNLKVELYKWAMECLFSLAFNEKLGFLDQLILSPSSDPGKLLDGMVGATEAARKCEYGLHLWRFFETPAFRSLVRSCDQIDGILNKYIDKTVNLLKEKKQKNLKFENLSLTECLLLKENVVEEDVMTTLLDMFVIGTNAMSHTTMCLLYHLARNPRCQIKLHEEIVQHGKNLNTKDLKHLKYLLACFKECLRLDPPIPILNRVLERDVVINHYHIPKGTYVMCASQLNSSREDYFEEAQKFKPERWLNDDFGSVGDPYQSFASVPFGSGLQSKTIKEMIRVQMSILIAKLIKKFKIEYNYGDFKNTNSEFLSSPMQLCKFRFVERVK